MNIIKKLLVTSFALVLITLGINYPAYATEQTNQTDTNLTEEADIPAIEEVDTSENEIELFLADEADLTEDTKDSQYIEDTQVGEDIEDTDAVDTDQTEEIFDPELYEIFIDEQGEVSYIEKKPVEQDNNEELIEQEANEEKDTKDEKKKKAPYSQGELRLLSSLIYAEAGNQSYKGMLAVANVVINRAKSKAYWHVNTIKEVIYDNKWSVQFSVTKPKNGKSQLDRALYFYDTGKYPGRNVEIEQKAMNKAIKAARAALSGENNIGDYLCFKVNKSTSAIRSKYQYKILEDHIFYRTK